MRKYLLPSALILLLGFGAAIAQTITRALQLSQDTTGAFSVDTNNGVYFPGHILSTGAGRPPPTVAGTGTPSVAGTDTAGTVTMGASATTATITFGQAYVTAPNCVVTWQAGLPTTAISYTVTTGSIALVQPTTSTNKVSYHCMSIS
jgi:hypothetical protein